eukprot:COSAG06_NODE_1232_length_10153_cov_24.843246_5_plen_82_part_00
MAPPVPAMEAALRGRWAVVTGGSGGIGRSIAIALHERGTSVDPHWVIASHSTGAVTATQFNLQSLCLCLPATLAVRACSQG